MDPDEFHRLRLLYPQAVLTDKRTGQVRVTRPEQQRLRAHYARAGIDLSKPFRSDRALLQAWSDSLSDEENDLVAAVMRAMGLIGEE